MFKVNYRNTRTVCKVCSKLTIKTLEWRHWRRSGVFIIKFERVNDSGFLLSLLVLLYFFYCLIFFVIVFQKQKKSFTTFLISKKKFYLSFSCPAMKLKPLIHVIHSFKVSSETVPRFWLKPKWVCFLRKDFERLLIFCLFREGNTGKNWFTKIHLNFNWNSEMIP